MQNGNIAVANELLGRPWSLRGNVVHGNGLGRTLGFPTANIRPDDPYKIIPKAGVYAVEVQGDSIQWTKGICNIGTNPTVGNSQTTIEVHIPSFSGDLYRQSLEIRFLRFMREERQFDNLETLRRQIKADVDNIQHLA